MCDDVVLVPLLLFFDRCRIMDNLLFGGLNTFTEKVFFSGILWGKKIAFQGFVHKVVPR